MTHRLSRSKVVHTDKQPRRAVHSKRERRRRNINRRLRHVLMPRHGRPRAAVRVHRHVQSAVAHGRHVNDKGEDGGGVASELVVVEGHLRANDIAEFVANK